MQLIKINKLEENRGQIDGLPSNPRFIKDDKFKKLRKSIEEDPEMLTLRPILVFPYEGKFIVIGGNMRYRAVIELGYNEVACVVIQPDTPIEKLKAYTIKDNASFGEWDWDLLANEWDESELNEWGVDVWNTDDVADEKVDFDEDYSGTVSQVNYLKFGKVKVMITDEELQVLYQKHKDYLDEFKIDSGFVTKYFIENGSN